MATLHDEHGRVLPAGWTRTTDDDGSVIYVNEHLQTVQSHSPCDFFPPNSFLPDAEVCGIHTSLSSRLKDCGSRLQPSRLHEARQLQLHDGVAAECLDPR